MAARGDTAGGGGPTSTPTEGRAALRMLSDRPLTDDADDRLGFAGYADALAELLDHPDTDTPLTIAISAQWGAGKTSLAKMVENRLKLRPMERGDPPHITCWFNAWMHDDAPHLGAAFAAEVAKKANRYRPMWRRLISPIPSAMLSPEERWRRRLGFAVVSIVVAVAIALLPGTGPALRKVFAPKTEVADRLQELFHSAAGVAILIYVALAASRKFYAIAQAAARFVDDPRSEAARGAMQDVSSQLGGLIQQATRVARQWLVLPRPARRLVIFVDDLERCRPPRAVEVCEVASQLLGHPNVVTVLIADMATIATSAEIKYAELEHLRASATDSSAKRWPPGAYGRLYLQKIVQIQFNLPPSPAENMPGLLAEAVGDTLGLQEDTVEDTVRPSTRKAPPVGESGPGSIPRIRVLFLFLQLGLQEVGSTFAFIGALGLVYSWWDQPQPSWFIIFCGAAFALGIWGLVLALIADYREYRAKQAQHQIDRDVRQVVNAGATTVEEVMKALDAAHLQPQRQELARQRAQRILADESPRRAEAEAEIKEHLPSLPRSAKRLFNHLRVLLVIAEQKQMFGGQPELQGKHLGKWAVLLEQWPELGSTLAADPGRLTVLEAATSIDQLSTRLGPAVPASVASQELLNFLQSPTKLQSLAEWSDNHTVDEVLAAQGIDHGVACHLVRRGSVAPVVQRLVHFEPASLQEPVPAKTGLMTAALTLWRKLRGREVARR
jgi:hypothetical protein